MNVYPEQVRARRTTPVFLWAEYGLIKRDWFFNDARKVYSISELAQLRKSNGRAYVCVERQIMRGKVRISLAERKAFPRFTMEFNLSDDIYFSDNLHAPLSDFCKMLAEWKNTGLLVDKSQLAIHW